MLLHAVKPPKAPTSSCSSSLSIISSMASGTWSRKRSGIARESAPAWPGITSSSRAAAIPRCDFTITSGALRARICGSERGVNFKPGDAHQPVDLRIIEQMVIRFLNGSARQRRRHTILNAHLGLQDALEMDLRNRSPDNRPRPRTLSPQWIRCRCSESHPACVKASAAWHAVCA